MAETVEAAQAAYRDGRYVDAAEMAKHAGGVDGFVLAAHALTIHARYFAAHNEKRQLYRQSMDLASSAIELDAEDATAHFELAKAMGQYALTIGRIRALDEQLVGRIRKHLDIALSINEASAAIHHAQGQWHAGLIDEMGAFLARSLFGAKRKDAVFHLNRALALDSDGIAINYGSAKGLLALGKRKYRGKAQELLLRVLDLPAVNAYEAVIRKEANELLRSLNEPDKQTHDR